MKKENKKAIKQIGELLLLSALFSFLSFMSFKEKPDKKYLLIPLASGGIGFPLILFAEKRPKNN